MRMRTEDRNSPSAQVGLLAQTLCLQLATGQAWSHLAEAGIECIVLKGPAIATWLYDKIEIRPSRDIDLLVSPTDVERAKHVLAELGYFTWLAGVAPCETGPNEEALFGPNRVMIDLHHSLIGVTGPRDHCWKVLSQRTTTLELATGTVVHVLDVPARTMHLALHVAQGGPADVKALSDLERGLTRVPFEEWRTAAKIAEQLNAVAPFAAGMRLSPLGEALAKRLQLPERANVELALRIAGAPQEAIFLERVANTPGTRRKLAIMARKEWPTAAYLQATSSLARRGPFGLLRARFSRQISLMRRVGPGLAAWWKVRYAPSQISQRLSARRRDRGT